MEVDISYKINSIVSHTVNVKLDINRNDICYLPLKGHGTTPQK